MNDNGLKIDRPIRPGYVFSHWSAVKPGSTTRVNRADGTVVEMPNDCPPFDFSKEVITKDTNLYAVFIPEVKVHFINGDEEIATENTVYGGKAYDPTPDGLRSLIEEGEELENAASHNSHKATPINKNDGVPKFGPFGQAI